VRSFLAPKASECRGSVQSFLAPKASECRGSVRCLQLGMRWVHLRICLSCRHVGCCDNSPGRHATGHFHSTRHPIIESLEPGEDWGWKP
jgi:hypothetical protein